jgi:hypothetical protein
MLLLMMIRVLQAAPLLQVTTDQRFHGGNDGWYDPVQ